MDSKSLSNTRWKCQYHIVFIPKKSMKRGQINEYDLCSIQYLS